MHFNVSLQAFRHLFEEKEMFVTFLPARRLGLEVDVLIGCECCCHFAPPESNGEEAKTRKRNIVIR